MNIAVWEFIQEAGNNNFAKWKIFKPPDSLRRIGWKPSPQGSSSCPKDVESSGTMRRIDGCLDTAPSWRFPGRRMPFKMVPSVGRGIACPTIRNIRRLLGPSGFVVGASWIVEGPKFAQEDWTPALLFFTLSICLLPCPNFGHGPCQGFNQGLVVQHCK